MRHSLFGAAVLVVLCAAPALADPSCGWASQEDCSDCSSCAGGGCGGCGQGDQKIHDSYAMNQRWYKQYMQPSRRAICQSMAVMVNNGWRRQNLMGAYHFDPKNPGELSEAGRRKAEWILTQAPAERRSVFVERTADHAETADRVQAVQQYAAGINIAAADVQETNLRNEGHPAGTVDAVFTGFSANQLPPVLPQASSAESDSAQ